MSQLNLQILPLVLQLHSALRIQLGKHIVPLPIKLQNVTVVLPETSPVADRHERDTYRLGIVVHDLLRLERHRGCTLVEYGVPWAVIKESRHGNALLETARQDIAPLGLSIPTFLVQRDQVFEVEDLEDVEEVGVGDALGAHGTQTVGIGDLLAKRAS